MFTEMMFSMIQMLNPKGLYLKDLVSRMAVLGHSVTLKSQGLGGELQSIDGVLSEGNPHSEFITKVQVWVQLLFFSFLTHHANSP